MGGTPFTAQGRHLPKPLTGPLVWSGSDFESEASYTLRFDKDEIDEIGNALGNFLSLRVQREHVSCRNFPLPRLASRLEQAAETIHKGCGFVVLRGIDPSRYSILQNVIIFLGLAAYVADKRGLQDKSGNVLAHITSSKLWDAPKEKRHGIHSNDALPCNYGEQSQHYLAPVFAIHDGNLLASMDPHRLGPHPTSPDEGIPPLTAPQRLALDRVADIARQKELRLRLNTGDLLFFNNWALLHRREAYQDDDCPSRHLVRLWLRNTKLGWSIPRQMLPPWRAAFEEDTTVEMTYPLHPPDTYTVPRYATGSAAFVMDDARSTGA
ncbi:Clavaminate synthase-like protein [Ophiocordyceps camponoti-floridani]|uniref:Clavaminate synthase-like protein n=1 Tax=Ophiocordyceps camponoti-floridani TaxID=2030778 RepID=A0A8H4Q7F5_9HYPO|nr:Clavaminate synthase-like protein [Ophiocordyceps camponoti-floridani]